MANPLITNFDTSKLFIGGNRYDTASYTNATGSEVTLPAGRIMGRVNSSDRVYPQVSTATTGSQIPMGILAETYVVANGATATLTYCIQGNVAAGLLTYGGSDTSATVCSLVDSASPANTVPLGTIKDILQGKGIILKSGTELTDIDNPQS